MTYALDVPLKEFRLENGMQVIVIPDRRTQIVTHSVWYRVGAADEISGKTGLAHFLEHLMFKGTPKFPYGEFDRLMDLNGAESNAFTTEDFTTYFQRTTADRLPLMMELEADRMQNLVLTEAIVKPELDVVREERRQRTENQPPALLNEQVDAALYTAHPYGRPTIGWMSDVAGLTMEDALAFYRKYYTPANAVLVVAGDVDPEQVHLLAQKYYGVLKNSAPASIRARTPEPAPLVERRLRMRDERASSVSLYRTYLTPSYAKADERVAESLFFLAEILGSGARSRLNQALVLDRKVAAYAGAWYSGNQYDSGRLTIYAVPNEGIAAETAEKVLDEVIADVLKNGVADLEIERTRKRVIAEDIYALDSQMGLVSVVGNAVMIGIEPSKAFDRTTWNKITADQVKLAAETYLRIENSVTAILEPKK